MGRKLPFSASVLARPKFPKQFTDPPRSKDLGIQSALERIYEFRKVGI